LWFDRRDAELLGHTVHIESGLCRIDFLIDGKKASFELFADMTADRLWGRMVSASGEPVEAPFKYITVLPDSTTPKEFPKYTSVKDNSAGKLSFRQILRACLPTGAMKKLELHGMGIIISIITLSSRFG